MIVPVIIGPTSSGKTSLALDLLKGTAGEIVSVDSRQLYKYMDVGTGKLPINADFSVKKDTNSWIINNIKIWGYDLVSPTEYFSAYDFVNFALSKLKENNTNGKQTYLVGGTGFYIDILTGNLTLNSSEPDLELRKTLETLDVAELQDKLKEVNKSLYNSIDLSNKVRLIRAIEKTLSTNSPKELILPSDIKYKYIGLHAPRTYLYERVDNWLKSIWGNPLFEEVEYIKNNYPSSTKLTGLVYKTALSYLNNEMVYDEAYERTKFDLHAYIRRQQTYFKAFSKKVLVDWVDISQDNYKETVYNIING